MFSRHLAINLCRSCLEMTDSPETGLWEPKDKILDVRSRTWEE